MRKLWILPLFIMMVIGLYAADVPQLQNVFNPFTGRQDYIVDHSTDITIGGKLFLGGDDDTYFQFDGTSVFLFINGVLNTTWADGISRLLLETVAVNFLLLETGDFILLETGDKIILE